MGGDLKKDDVWAGLQRAPNGNFYWPRSGLPFPSHNLSEAWHEKQPHKEEGSCAYFDLSYSESNLKGTLFHNYPCIGGIEFTVCQIPYV